ADARPSTRSLGLPDCLASAASPLRSTPHRSDRALASLAAARYDGSCLTWLLLRKLLGFLSPSTFSHWSTVLLVLPLFSLSPRLWGSQYPCRPGRSTSPED